MKPGARWSAWPPIRDADRVRWYARHPIPGAGPLVRWYARLPTLAAGPVVRWSARSLIPAADQAR